MKIRVEIHDEDGYAMVFEESDDYWDEDQAAANLTRLAERAAQQLTQNEDLGKSTSLIPDVITAGPFRIDTSSQTKQVVSGSHSPHARATLDYINTHYNKKEN